MKNKIMIYGWYDSMNLGDDAMMLGINNLLRNNNKEVIYYNFKDEQHNYFKNDLGTINYINRYNEDYTSTKQRSVRIIKKILIYLKKILFGDDDLKEVDKIIFMGGGYINSLWSKELKEILILALIGKRNRCKIYFTGQTAGPYSSCIDKYCAKLIYRLGESITIREIESLKLLEGYGIKNLKYGVDDFYLHDIKNNERFKLENKNKYFILNIKSFKNYDEGIEKIVKLAKNIYMKTGFSIAIVPFGKGVRPKDLECSKKISKMLDSEKISNFIVDINSFNDLISVFSSTEFTVGMAYHSLVISLYFNKMAVGLYEGEYYKSKITGILNHYSLDDQAYNFRKITDDDIERIAIDIIERFNKIDKDSISNNTNRMKNICRDTWENIIFS